MDNNEDNNTIKINLQRRPLASRRAQIATINSLVILLASQYTERPRLHIETHLHLTVILPHP